MQNGIADEIKRRVTMRQVLERYGMEASRAGFMCCPFHREKTPSLKIYPDARGWHCFGCHTGGSVVDFVMKMDGVPFQEACKRLDFTFALGLYGPRTFAQMREQKRAAEARRLQKIEQDQDADCRDVLSRYFLWLRTHEKQTEAMTFDEEYIERILDIRENLKFDARARCAALATKHEDGGDYIAALGVGSGA